MISCMQFIWRFSIFAGHFLFSGKVLPQKHKNFTDAR